MDELRTFYGNFLIDHINCLYTSNDEYKMIFPTIECLRLSTTAADQHYHTHKDKF